MPRHFVASLLRTVELSDQLVLLDLSAGTYDVVDAVGTTMWRQLLLAPEERDLPGLASTYGVELSVIESDISEFAEAQRAAGRLVTQRLPPTPPSGLLARHHPTVGRALLERHSAQRALQRGFSEAYDDRTDRAADVTAPRVPVERVLKLYRRADGLFPTREAPLDCLPRSLGLTRFLRSAGWPAEHVIGVALYPFEAHAWVELDGVALDETLSALGRYVTIARA